MKQQRSNYLSTIGRLRSGERERSSSIEIAPNITVELNDKDELIGVEILEASRFVRDTVLESALGRMLQLPVSRPIAE